MKLDRFDTAEARRKFVLKFCHANPNCSTRQMADAMNVSLDSAANVARDMLTRGELEQHGKMPRITYTALKTTTVSATEMRDLMKRKMNTARVEYLQCKTKPKPKTKPGVYVHIPGKFAGTDHPEGHPLSNQGGQGNLRRAVFICSTLA